MATVEDTTGSLPAIVGAGASVDGVEKADSEYECELMIEALKKELSAVRVRMILVDIHYSIKKTSSSYFPELE